MNTKDNWLTTATIHDEHRAAVWGAIFPGANVPIKSILTSKADLPGHPHADVYMLDLDAISDRQREKLIETLAGLFGMSEEDVRSDLAQGVPILADDVSVVTRDQGLFFSLIPEFDDVPASELPGWEDEHPSMAGLDDWDGLLERDPDLDDDDL